MKKQIKTKEKEIVEDEGIRISLMGRKKYAEMRKSELQTKHFHNK